MDIGVGSFVFSLGIISTKSYHHDMSMSRFLLKNIRKSLPVIALGMVRVIMVKGVEYPVSQDVLHCHHGITADDGRNTSQSMACIGTFSSPLHLCPSLVP